MYKKKFRLCGQVVQFPASFRKPKILYIKFYSAKFNKISDNVLNSHRIFIFDSYFTFFPFYLYPFPHHIYILLIKFNIPAKQKYDECVKETRLRHLFFIYHIKNEHSSWFSFIQTFIIISQKHIRQVYHKKVGYIYFFILNLI